MLGEKKGPELHEATSGDEKKLRSIERFFQRDEIYRKRFLVPNAVTLANMFCGFLAIIYATSGRYEKAALAIIIAIVLDGLDGRVARKLNASSDFGVEFDSFSDLVSFGLAPAILVYRWAFAPVADEFGVLVCFSFALAAAARLARFNVQSEDLSKFTGLPTPGAAGLVAALIHLFPEFSSSYLNIGLVTALVLSLATMMVSNIEFFSVKTIQLKKPSPPIVLLLGAGIGLAWYNSKYALLGMGTVYVLSGPFLSLKTKFTKPSST